MASVSEGICETDPNFAVICSFLSRYGALLRVPEISYVDLQEYIQCTSHGMAYLLHNDVRSLLLIDASCLPLLFENRYYRTCIDGFYFLRFLGPITSFSIGVLKWHIMQDTINQWNNGSHLQDCLIAQDYFAYI